MSEFALPEGWCFSKISDISVKGEQRKPEATENFTYIDIGSIDRNLKMVSEPQRVQGDKAPSRARKVIHTGDVLVSLTRPNLNAVALVPESYDKQIASTGFEVIKPVAVDSNYIFALVRSKHFIDTISGSTQGALYPAAKSSDVQAYSFPLPPLAEQKVIAQKLDTLLAQVENTKARLERTRETIKRFRQSVLAAAVSGKLTECVRDLKHVPWAEATLSDVASNIVDCPHSTPKWTASGKLCVRTTAFKPFLLDLSDQRFVSEDTFIARTTRLKPEPGDILYSREGAILGIACQIPSGVELCLGQRMIVIRAGNNIDAKYLTIVLNSEHILSTIKNMTMGSAAPRINMRDIKSFKIPMPCYDEQTEIVRRVEQLYAHADTIEKQVEAAQTRVNNLTQSILAKAFRGELTEQWRRDNPELISGENSAEALLEKIKSERAIMDGKKIKARRKPKAKAETTA